MVAPTLAETLKNSRIKLHDPAKVKQIVGEGCVVGINAATDAKKK